MTLQRKSTNTKKDGKRKREQKLQDKGNNQQNGNSKSFPTSNYFKCKWIKLPKQKTQTSWKDLKKKKNPTIWYLQEIHLRFMDTKNESGRIEKNILGK